MPMAITDAADVFESDMLDFSDLPLDTEQIFTEAEYAYIGRRIGIVEGRAETPVSAFNSSI